MVTDFFFWHGYFSYLLDSRRADICRVAGGKSEIKADFHIIFPKYNCNYKVNKYFMTKHKLIYHAWNLNLERAWLNLTLSIGLLNLVIKSWFMFGHELHKYFYILKCFFYYPTCLFSQRRRYPFQPVRRR